MHKNKPVLPKMDDRNRPAWLVGWFLQKAGMDERVLHTTTTDSERQIMLVRLPR